jgi:isoquinoline 1-oxidoreductase alpha subunit
MILLTINGRTYERDIEADMPLLWAIRDELGLTGTKFGCGAGLCGACTVHVDGTAIRSCMVTVGEAQGKPIVTIEGLGGTNRVQQAWIAAQVPQCGYCQSGMIMAVEALLRENAAPTDRDIDEAITNICRCGTYPRIRNAIRIAAGS